MCHGNVQLDQTTNFEVRLADLSAWIDRNWTFAEEHHEDECVCSSMYILGLAYAPL